MSIYHNADNTEPRTCVVHNPGDLACDASCPYRLRENDDPAPDAEVVDEPREPDHGPQTCVFHPGGMHCPADCEGRLGASLGPASVDEMDEATADIIARDSE